MEMGVILNVSQKLLVVLFIVRLLLKDVDILIL
jgi:hypothetical protein